MFFIRLNKKYNTRLRVRIRRDESKLILLESGKLGIQEFALSISMFIFTMFVARLGQNALAANEIALMLCRLALCLPLPLVQQQRYW